jgi:hypothetical protein
MMQALHQKMSLLSVTGQSEGHSPRGGLLFQNKVGPAPRESIVRFDLDEGAQPKTEKQSSRPLLTVPQDEF